jgi:GNAT superfamily N-acetyltransferase
MGERVVVRPVQTKKENKQFINFPYTLYKKILRNPYWAAPLRIDEKNLMDRQKFPFYRHAIVGRIVGTIDEQYHKFREKDVAYFGFFECIHDREAAFALFDAALGWAKSNGMKRIIGPISPTTNHILGVLQNAFTGVPMIQVPYNPDYYPALYDAYGFGKEKDHFAFIVHKGELALSDKIRRVVDLVRKRQKVVIEPVDMKHYPEYVRIAKDLYNTTWSDNSDFVPWTAEEFDFLAKDLKMAIVPELTFLARVNGVPVGLSIALRNFNEIFVKMNGRLLPTGIFRLLLGQKKIKSVRLAIMGVLPEYRNMGIDAAFTLETYDRGVAMGMDTCEMSLILEDNYPLINMFEKWGAPAYRTYRVYTKSLMS